MTIFPSTARIRSNRMRDPICPPWCAGHDELYQPWEESEQNVIRNHAGDFDLHKVGLSLNAPESHRSTIPLVPQVEVMVDSLVGQAILSPSQARQLAARLVTLAEQAEEYVR